MGGNDGKRSAARRSGTWLAAAFAMSFPTVAAWSYFLALARPDARVNPWQQAAYVAGKVVQFAFPLVFLILARGPWPRPLVPRRTGLGLGLAFGLAVAAVMLGLYFGLLRGSSFLAGTPAMVRQKLQQVALATPGRYLALAGFLAVAHSLLEEYYWRWFVFGQLRQVTSPAVAVTLSSVAFAAHHVVVLYVYLPGALLSAVLPFSASIAVGGAVWAWLYERAGTLYPSWLSHLIVDAAIFIIGWDLLWPAGA